MAKAPKPQECQTQQTGQEMSAHMNHPAAVDQKRRHIVQHVALLLVSPLAASLLAGCSPSADTGHASDGAGESKSEGASEATSEGDGPSEGTSTSFFTEHEAHTLFSVARSLFPHQSLPTEPYARVVQSLDTLANANSDVGVLLRRSVEVLDQHSGGEWLSASAGKQQAALDTWQRDEQFGLILNTSIDTLYRDPEVWRLIGYEGSSLEHGGYLHRGFDDIDWLDDAQQESK